jgi:hypothetical protein
VSKIEGKANYRKLANDARAEVCGKGAGRDVIGEAWWLAELDQYGNPKLVDGGHPGREGAEKAMRLYRGLGFERGERYAVARITLYKPAPYQEGEGAPAHSAFATMVREVTR